MPQIVEVDGIGEIEFPDEMSADDIRSALKRKLPTQAPSEPSSRLPWNMEVQEPSPESWRDTLDLPTPGQAATKLTSGVALGYGHALSGIANTVRAMAPVAAVVANRLQPLSETRAPLEGVASLAVNKVGAATKEKSDRILERYNPVSEQAGHGGVLDLIGKVGEAAGTMLPAIPIGAMSPMAAIMGYFPVLSFGSTHEAAKAKYMEAGMSESEADQKALLPAAASAVITATVGKLFGPKGEDLARAVSSSLSAEAMAAIRQAEQTLTKQSTGDPVRGLMAAIVQNAMHSAGVMFKFSTSDQIGQEMLAKATYNPNKSFGEIASDVIATALSSPVIGAAMGLPGGVGEVAAKVSEGMARREALKQARLRKGSPERAADLRARQQTEDIMTAGRNRLAQVPGEAEPTVEGNDTKSLRRVTELTDEELNEERTTLRALAPTLAELQKQPEAWQRIKEISSELVRRKEKVAEAKVVEAVPPIEPVAPGMVRFYHGGVPGVGPRDLTPYYAYAQGYANKSVGGIVQYVDIPESSPLLKKVFDDTDLPTKAPYAHFTAPAEIMAQAKPFTPTELVAEKPADKPVVPPEPVKPVEEPRADPLLSEVRLQLNLSKEEAQAILATRDWNAQSGVIRQSMTRRGTIGADDSAKAALDQAMEWLDKKGLSDSPQRQPKPEVPPAAPERPRFEVQTSPIEGREPVVAHGHWLVMSARDLTPSTTVQATQERNLNTAGAKQAIADMAARWRPELSGDSKLATDGAPIVAEVVEGDKVGTKILAGNTRVSAIRLLYESANEKSKEYKAWVVAEAKRLGIETGGLKDPVLVRMATDFRNGTHADFARDSNADLARQFTPTELAMADARAIQDGNLLNAFTIDENGVINRGFLDAIYGQMKNRGPLRASDGRYLPEMEKRVKVAIMSLLLSGHPEAEWLIRQIVEQSDQWGISRQINGIMAQSAGLLRIRNIMPELDISQDMANAFRDFLRFKQAMAAKEVRGLDEWLGQHDMFEAARTPESALFLRWFTEAKSAQAISEGLDKYIRAVELRAKSKGTVDMFGGSIPEASRAQLLEGALKNEKSAEQVELNVGGGKPGDGKPVEPEKPVAGPEPVPAEAPPGEIPFEQISEGHRRFAAELIKLEKGGALDAERRILLQELFRNADGKFLGTLTMEASGRIRSGGMAYLKKRTLALRKGLLKLSTPESKFWNEPANEPVVLFLHEFGHLAHQFILTNADRKVVSEVFGNLTREERRTLFKQFSSEPNMANYFAKNEQEFLAQSFAEYWISRKVPSAKLKPILKRLYDTFVEAIKRVLGIEGGVRAQMNTLTPLFEKMMTAAESGEEPTHFMEDAGSLAPTKAEAMKVIETAEQRRARGASRAVEEEARLIGGQVGWLSAKLESMIPRDVLGEDASGRELSDMVRIRQAALEKVGHGEVARTREFIEGFIEPTDFYREMERLATSPIRETFRKEAGMRFKLVRTQMEDVIAEHAKLDAMIQGEWFQEKLARADIKMQRAHLLEYFQKIFNANVADALAGFAKMLEREANTEGRAEVILNQIAGAKKKAEYSEAVRSAVAGMVNKMAQYPEAADLLYRISPAEGDIRAVIDEYRRLQPEGRPEDIIVQWAAETLAHANEATRAIVAVLGAERVESVRKEYTELEQKLADELRANPRQAARAVVRGVSKYATAAERAMTAWRAIHDDVVNTSREYETLSIAADVAKRFIADPTVKQYERDVYGLDRPEGPVIQPRPDKADKYDSPDYATVLPDGTLSKEIKLFGDTDKFEASFAEMNRVMEVISDFLTDNPQDPTVDYWARKLAYFQNVMATSRTMAPSKFVAPWGLGVVNRPLGMLQFFADGLGTREGGRFKVSLTNHNRATELAKKLLHDNVYELTNIHLDAAESHGFTGARAPVTWYEEIGNALYSSWRNPEGGLKAGDRINGYVITDADMKALAFDADVTRQGFRIVQGGATRGREGVMQPVYFETEIGDTGEKVAVQSTDITSHTTTRHYSRRALGIIDSFMEANDGGKLRIINQNFWPLVVAHMRDRANVFFDGASRFENVYRLLSEEIDQRGLPSADRNLQWLVDKIIEIDGEHLEPPEGTDIKSYVLGELLNEFNQMMTRLKNLGGEDTPNKVETLEQRSSFTKSARRPQAGYWLYDHGFKEMSSLANFAFAIHGYYFERAALDMDRVIADLKTSRENLNNRLAFRASQEGTDVVKVRRGVIKEQSARVKSGQTFEDWENIDRQIEVAQRLRDLYKQVYSAGGNAADFDLTKVSRTIGAAVGSTLLSELNTIRNLFTGVLYLGQKINSVDGTIWRAYPEAFWKTQTVGAFKYGASALLGLVKAGTAGPVKGVAAAYRPLLQGKFRVAFARFLEPMLVELSQNMASRIEMQRFLEERGYSEKFNTADDVLAKMRIPTEGGTVRSTPSFDSVLGRGAYGLLTMLEAPIVTGVGKALTPRGLGDLPLNHATITATFDIANRLETRLRWLHAKYKDNGVKRWDFAQLNSPGNHLSAAEVYGKWFGLPRTNQNLNHLVNWFEYGPEGFQDAAIRFLAKLEAGVKDAQFLTDDQKWNLADAAVHDVNKGGVMNRPLQFRRQEGMAQLVAPFLGWPTHRFRTWVKYANRAAVDPQTAKAVMWASVMMTTILPALAVGAIVDPYTELVARWFYRLLRTEERATRLPWERVGAKSQAIGVAISAANMIPFVDAIANTMLNDLPSRARSQPTLFAQNKVMDVLKYFGGVMQTGDWTYGLPQLAKGTLPLSAVVINRLPGVEGSIEALNARRLMTRYGDQDLLRKPAGQTGGQLSELSPYPEKMLNAAMRGDDAGFMAAYQEAVAKATEMGKDEPEKYVAKLFAARNPYDRSFTRKLTAGEQAAFKEKLNPAEAALVNGVEEKFSHAAGLIGASSNFVKQETGGGSGWGSGGGIPSIPRPNGLRRGRAGLTGSSRQVSGGRRLRLGRGVRLSGPAKVRRAGARLARGRAPKSYQPRLKRFRMRRPA